LGLKIMQIDLRVLELLSSKLCHDLVSPVSAINNGVELIEDIGGSVVDEAMKLIGESAGHASRRLRLYRIAYGRAGSDENLPVRDVRQVAEHYVLGGKMVLTWPEGQPVEALAMHKGYLKTLLNVLILAEEVLAYGGTTVLHSSAGEEPGCRVEVAGRNAHLSALNLAAIEGTAAIEELTPRSIQSYITGRFAAHFNLKLKYDQSTADRLEFELSAL
jgi:histidine phosphotransferase ChpT